MFRAYWLYVSKYLYKIQKKTFPPLCFQTISIHTKCFRKDLRPRAVPKTINDDDLCVWSNNEVELLLHVFIHCGEFRSSSVQHMLAPPHHGVMIKQKQRYIINMLSDKKLQSPNAFAMHTKPRRTRARKKCAILWRFELSKCAWNLFGKANLLYSSTLNACLYFVWQNDHRLSSCTVATVIRHELDRA